MILSHLGKKPAVDPSAYVAPNATLCGDVRVARGSRIMFGACVIAEGKPIVLDRNSIVMENAVIRSTDEHAATIGDYCLVGPHSLLVGCVLEDCVFIATGATVLHGARLGFQRGGARQRRSCTCGLNYQLTRLYPLVGLRLAPLPVSCPRIVMTRSGQSRNR